MSDDRPDRSAYPYVWAVAVGLPGYAIVHYSDGLALDLLGGLLMVIGLAPVALFELWNLATLPCFVADKVSPSADSQRARHLESAERERQAARRRLAKLQRERERNQS